MTRIGGTHDEICRLSSAALVLVAGAAFAHHGWGSYDAAHPVTVVGPIVTSKFENQHATITVKGKPTRLWTVTLAPTSRMKQSRSDGEGHCGWPERL